jgi:hypothetical protein
LRLLAFLFRLFVCFGLTCRFRFRLCSLSDLARRISFGSCGRPRAHLLSLALLLDRSRCGCSCLQFARHGFVALALLTCGFKLHFLARGDCGGLRCPGSFLLVLLRAQCLDFAAASARHLLRQSQLLGELFIFALASGGPRSSSRSNSRSSSGGVTAVGFGQGAREGCSAPSGTRRQHSQLRIRITSGMRGCRSCRGARLPLR